MKPEALLIITPGFPENEGDTTCLPPQQVFVKSLQQVQPELKVIVLTLQYPFFSGNYTWHGIKVIAFGSAKETYITKTIGYIRIWRMLNKLRRAYNIIGLLSFWFGKCALIGNAFGKQHRLKHLHWILGQDAKPGNPYFNRIKPQPGSLIALSDFIAHEVQKNYGVLSQHIITVGIDPASFCQQSTDRDIDILGAGSLIPLKRFDIFLEVIASLKPGFPDIRTAICGKGPEMQRLQTLAAHLGLTDNVTFYGELPHSKVLALMQRSRIFLHASAYEGFGSVCLEALYAGAHVISFVKPMDKPITNWVIVKDKEEMIAAVKEKLQCPYLSHEPVLPYSIPDNAKAMLRLFTITPKREIPHRDNVF